MKFRALLLILFASHCLAYGQSGFNDSISASRNQLTRQAMVVLGSWSVANIASGFLIAGTTQGQDKYVWRMNAYWNIFNLGIAGLGYHSLIKTAGRKWSLAENNTSQQAIEKLYLFNAGLDLVYITGGLYLRENGKNQSRPDKKAQLSGYGTAVILQGTFLLAMDAVLFSLHHKNTTRVNNRIRELDLKAGPGSFSLTYSF